MPPMPRIERLAATMTPMMRMIGSKAFARRGTPGVADLMQGNPHELALPAFIDVLPGTIVELPGWFRLSLTANDEMVEQALPVFASALLEFATA